MGAGASTATLAISQVPLTISTPARPQVVIAVTNSESMDGSTITYCNGTGNSGANCSNGFSSTYTGRGGALLTGSGAVGGLTGSASPINYPVPANFTPPVTGGAAGSMQPYTSTVSGGQLADNSPSRLNVAKAGILSILNTYLATTDFALLSYQMSNTSRFTTWVYYMSPAGGFGFTNTPTATSSTDTVLNPCYGYSSSSSSSVKSNCGSIVTALSASSSTVSGSQYMTVGATSDDASINDVLYASNLNPVFLTYGTVSPSNPYSYFSLNSYKNGSISVSYSKVAPNSGGWSTSPTNAGYVPFTPQVLYAQRGWGYGGSQSYSAAATNVAMTNLGSPSASQLTSAYNSFSPFLQPETNSTSTSEIKAAAGQSPIYALLKTAQTSFTSTSSSSGCTPQKYVVLITDGLPTQDKSGYYWPPAGSAAATGYGVTASFNADGSLNVAGTNDQALLDAISQIQTLASAGIKTYVIGLGAGVAPATNPTAAQTLTAMAVAGNTGSYYPAVSPAAFSSALGSILVQIQKGSYDQASVALNSTTLSTNTQAFLASFNPSDTPYSDWTGDLAAYALGTSGGLNVSTSASWSAQTQVDDFASGSGWQNTRLIATWDAVNNKGVPFRWPATGVTGINSTQQSQLQPSDTKGSLRVNYLRGDASQEARNGGAFRNRSHLLGDIVDSGPVYVAKPDGPYIDSSYQTFISNNANRTPMLYVGANDGMVHAFNASTGNEAFAFVPNGVFANLYQLTSTSYNSNHIYFVDGSPQAGDVMFADGSWHSVLAGGLGGGGKTIYALDVTSPSSLTSETALANAALWEFSDSGMGYSFGRPTIARLNGSNAFAVLFGNGYASSGNHAIFYAVNPQTGATLAKIDLCSSVPAACSSSAPQGLSEVVAVNSSGNAGAAVDTVYAGDLQGNLWAINVSSANPANWSVRLLFTATDSSGNHQPITSAPAATLNPNFPKQKGMMVFFGTGQLLAQSDLTNTNTQAFYAVYDNMTITSLTPSNLLQQTETAITTSVSGFPSTTVSSSLYNWQSPNPPLSCVVGRTCPTLYGWYYTLSFAGSGSRMLTNPQLFAGNVVYTTFSPSATPCTAGGSSFLMSSNYATGGPPSQPFLDANGDGLVNSSDVYNQQPLSGVQLGSFFASTPAFVVSNQGGYTASILVGGGNSSSRNNCANGKLSCTSSSPSQQYYSWSGWWQIL
ncbi:pilus assembly protein [Chromobacterium violaceum]|uniref:Tfp pilus assembly protein, tip-associated adhesin PilY1 n=1 Tax=Chromobacterium violaceum TaxID=536 RepID=A0AAX2MEI1_CHRVL|nr:PilC/PilY family type IV pilus protein [Chromobacterium violaceum]SUY93078.1 Tfp pilus assembly protein, tip-associated adhesin PilY1 [Chromobacterium violaceum]